MTISKHFIYRADFDQMVSMDLELQDLVTFLKDEEEKRFLDRSQRLRIRLSKGELLELKSKKSFAILNFRCGTYRSEDAVSGETIAAQVVEGHAVKAVRQRVSAEARLFDQARQSAASAAHALRQELVEGDAIAGYYVDEGDERFEEEIIEEAKSVG